jgi:hypothetical protein
MKERRRLERFGLNTSARVQVEPESGRKAELNLMTKDVSSDGAFLYTSKPLAEGVSVKMEFLISSDVFRYQARANGRAKVGVKGKVIRVDSNGIAIGFDSKYRITSINGGNQTQSST